MRTQLRIVVLSLVSLMYGCAATGQGRGPTFDEFRKNIDTYGVPYWEKAAGQIKAIRARVTHPFHVQILENLDSESRAGHVNEALDSITNNSDPNALDAKMLWLRWNILAENTDGRFAYAYAYGLSRSKNERGSLMNEAATFFLLGRTSLAIDGARCADRASPQVAVIRLENDPRMRPIIKYIEGLSGPKKAEMLMHVVSIEEMRGERKPQEWLCNLGAMATLQALENKENISVVQSNNKSLPENVIVVNTSNVTPEFVAEDRWRKARKDILDNTIRSVAPSAT